MMLAGLGRLRRVGLVAAILGASAMLIAACVDDRPEACRTVTNALDVDSECGRGFVCTTDGYCERECRHDHQCPCGSFCAPSCGLCILDDLSGPATCKAFKFGYGAPETALGACREDIESLIAAEVVADAALEADVAPAEIGARRDSAGRRWSCRLPLNAPQCANSDGDASTEAGAADANEDVFSNSDGASDDSAADAGDLDAALDASGIGGDQ
ncbi:MAG: hypothetical protein KF850_40155 [Labilithrix sp.]|nr:hypothetical protein [Labilithrix sp.]MBX3218288.1 hypothetical protein [Labilithrix sp.]